MTAPSRAVTVSLTSDQTAESAFLAILASCLTQISDNRMAILATEDPEGPHQLRIGLRRLRTAFRLFRKLLTDDTWSAGLAEEARELGGLVGEPRDLDVLMTEIVAPMAQNLPEHVSSASLVQVLGQRREEARLALLDDLRQPHWNRFLLALTAYISLQGWRESASNDSLGEWRKPVSAVAGDALSRQLKKIIGFGDRLEGLSIAERHDMRKALKKLRYGLEFFAPLYPRGRMKPYLKHMKKLQNVFGYLNDVAMAERLLDHLDDLDKDGAFTAGFCLATHQAAAKSEWERAMELWQTLEASKPAWRQ